MPQTVSELIRQLRPVLDDERVLRALATVPRERFVPWGLRGHAWENTALPIAAGQSISQPVVVARMCELLALTGGEVVLDVGTGSGYHAAVLSRLCAHVYSVERHPELTRGARRALERAGIDNVTLLSGDGTRGHLAAAPYDAVNVAARAEEVPPALLVQLAPAGRLVMPLAGPPQRLVVLRRSGGAIHREEHERVSFVPLVAGRPDP
jgi:protein-L-isoaspartate(D-aspartate) O-methyltransferase